MVKGGVESQDQVMIRNYRGAAAVHNLAGLRWTTAQCEWCDESHVEAENIY